MGITGIIRRVDDLGRVVIPKEVRRKYGIKEGTAMELFAEKEGVLFKKYEPTIDLLERVEEIKDGFADVKWDMDKEKVDEIEKCIIALQNALKF